MELLDTLWILFSAILVALMQPGFTALEAGSTRAKNSISTAIKNISDFLISTLIFITFGASLMLGQSEYGWFGWQELFFYQDDFSNIVFVIFQAMFASTAVTIISGSIAERSRYPTYLLIAIWISLIIYPIQAHWVWNEQGWLNTLGFYDFAGSTVVHSVGGWAALAAIMIIGPRLGRFEMHSKFEKSNLAMSALGVFFIWLGWLGFNGGSVLALNKEAGSVILNTIIAGSAGGLTGLLYSRIKFGYYDFDSIIHGILAGLVCITASANLANPIEAIFMGALGFTSYEIGRKLLVRLKLDDAIEAIPVHLFAGVSGTLAVALFYPEGEKLSQLTIQATGVFIIGAYAFVLTYLFLTLVNRVYPIRASEPDEIIGMNISEHKASNSLHDLIHMMHLQATSQDFSKKIPVEPYADAAVISEFYNNVIMAFNKLTDDNERLLKEVEYQANYDQLTNLPKRRILFTELEKAIHGLQVNPAMHALMFIDLDGFKQANDQFGHDAGDDILKEVALRLKHALNKNDICSRFGGDEFVILVWDVEQTSNAENIAQRLIETISEPMHTQQGIAVDIGCSIGLKTFDQTNQLSLDDLLKEADSAMYQAKKSGKGKWVHA